MSESRDVGEISDKSALGRINHLPNECEFYKDNEFCMIHLILGYGDGCLNEFSRRTCDNHHPYEERALEIVDALNE